MNAQDTALKLGLELVPCGSRVTCDPPPTDTDQDYVVAVPREREQEVQKALMDDGWTMCGSEVCTGLSSEWNSYRLGEDNLILIWNPALFACFTAATQIAKALNLLCKNDRVTLFQNMERVWPGLSVSVADIEEIFA